MLIQDNREFRIMSDPNLPVPTITLDWDQPDKVIIHIGPNPNPEVCAKVRIFYFPGLVTREAVEADSAVVGWSMPVNWVHALSWNGWLADVTEPVIIHQLLPPLPRSISYWVQWLSHQGFRGTLSNPVSANFPS